MTLTYSLFINVILCFDRCNSVILYLVFFSGKNDSLKSSFISNSCEKLNVKKMKMVFRPKSVRVYSIQYIKRSDDSKTKQEPMGFKEDIKISTMHNLNFTKG